MNPEYQTHAKKIGKALVKAGLRSGPGDPPLTEEQPAATSDDPPSEYPPEPAEQRIRGYDDIVPVVFGHLR